MYYLQIASGGALVGAILTEIKYKDLNRGQKINIDGLTRVLKINELYLRTQATAGLVFATAGVAIIVGMAALMARTSNSRKSENKRKFFSCMVCFFFPPFSS